ncbi:oxidase cueO precursor [Rhizodiscina lignyota]|uniref:Oxidase cueO n=1 Tax=Rhizodiscina lignyota TaxID=1504668 RepID=A0A9P4M2K0_9PEZI|nr:oxidase cueO precursor [Rhizodiscina lignyota]
MLINALLFSSFATLSLAKDWESPEYKYFFQFPLPLPSTKSPLKTFTNPATGNPIDYYEVDIKPVEQQLYPGLGKTRLVGYDGQVPGPTFRMTQGREAIVRFINHADRANSVHLHGSYSRAPFDGWAEDTTEPGQYKDYYYPNVQAARTLWYHDHAIDHTAENAYFGQAGFYILSDPEEQALNLPSGKYEVALGLSSRRYNKDGSLWDPEKNGEKTSIYGDVFHVNGQPWPYLKVEPRKYRFRFLNSAVSRSFELSLVEDTKTSTKIPMTVIGSDTGLLLNSVQTTDLDISMAERWEVVIDFASYAGKNLTFKNVGDIGADTKYAGTDRVMRFVVGTVVTSTENNGPIPSKLRDVPFPPFKTTVDRHFRFESSGGQWKINGVTWADEANRVMAKPLRGAIEVWELENSSGGWTHPIHIHLIDFQIISRTGGQRNTVLPYEKVALKDVVWLGKGETVKVIARYAPWDGLYMFHCHNLIHEDHEMMAAFNVTGLEDFGYTEKTHFIDPMEPRYRAKSFSATDLTDRTGDFSDSAIEDKVNYFTDLDAYSDVSELEEELEEYWSTRSATTLQTVTTSKSSSSKTTSSTKTKDDDDDKKTSSSKTSSTKTKDDDDDKKTTSKKTSSTKATTTSTKR